MDTPVISIPTSINPTVVYFWHNYNLEAGHDGAVIEMSIDNGMITDIIAAGGSFSQGNYNGTIATGFFSPIAGRQAWTGNSNGWVDSHVVLPNTTMGHNVRIRFRLATDCAVASVGWYVDSIQVAYYFPDSSPTPTLTPSSPIPTATANATATATATSIPTVTPTPGSIVSISGTVGQCTAAGPSDFLLPGVILSLTGGTGGATTTDSSGNYVLSVAPGINYTVTPSKAPRAPGSVGINSVDVVAIQRHFLLIGAPLSGCRLTAADCAAPTGITTGDVVATQRFFLNFTSGIGNVGKYQFTPANRTYTPLNVSQTNQDYDTIVLGDVAAPYAQ